MRFLTLALFGIMVVAAIVGFVMVTEHTPGGMWVLAGSATGLMLAYLIDKRVEQQAEARRDEKLDADIQTHLAKMQHAGYAFSVRGSSGLAGALLLAGLGIMFLVAAPHETINPANAIGLGILIFAFPAGLQGLLLSGRPLITVTRQGFQTPIVGAIPWNAVLGIDVMEAIVGKDVPHHILRLYVPTLRNYFAAFPAVARMLYFLQFWRSKTIVTIRLQYPDQDPELVERVARELWFASTGRDYLWDPDANEDADRPLRHTGEFARDTVAQTAIEAPAAAPPFTGNAPIVDKERARISAEWRTIFIVIAVLLALAMLVKFLKHNF